MEKKANYALVGGRRVLSFRGRLRGLARSLQFAQ